MRTLAALVALACLGCGAADEPTFTSTPANGGSSVVITGDAYPANPVYGAVGSMAVFEAAVCGGIGRMVLYVKLSWVPGMCRMLQQDEKHVGTGHVYFSADLVRYDGSAEFPAGTYPITQLNDVDVLNGQGRLRSSAAIIAYGPLCYVATEVPGTGTFTIDSADATGVRGSVDLVFSDGSTAAGSFGSPVCDELGDVCTGSAIHRVSENATCLP